jgi:hypothetical protein
MSPTQTEDRLVGSIIGGRYRIEEELGRGGMGVVYRAEHVELGQKVALKVLTSDVLATNTAVDRFLREARTTASLGHPNIVRVQDLGKLDDGRPYLVMELLSGEGLDERIAQKGTLSVEEVVPILTQTAAALDAIHSLGMVHRDVKPENIFLARALDGVETAKLVDFGLVGMSRPDLDEDRLTQTGLIYGTPPYMAPETMAEKTPSPKWDVYALGVVVFEALTGEIPLAGDNPLECLTKRTMEDPPRLGDVSERRFPEAIEKVVRRGLNRFADARYDSAGELAAAFEGAARDGAGGGDSESKNGVEQPTVAGRPSVGTPMKPLGSGDAVERDEIELPVSLPRAAIAIVGIVAAVLVASLVFVLVPERVEPEIADLADVDEGDASPTSAQTPEHEPGVAVDASVEQASSPAIDATTTNRASMRPRMNGASTNHSDSVERGMGSGREGSEVGVGSPPTNVDELEREANRALASGNLARARALFRDVTESSPNRAPSWRGLGVTAERLGRRTEAAGAYRRYLALASSAPDAEAVRRRLQSLEP